MQNQRNYLLQAGLLTLIFSAFIPQSESEAEEVQVDSGSTMLFLLAHQKPNGAFGPIDQEHSDLAWNYPAAHALLLLEADIPRSEDCLKNGQWAAFRTKEAHPTNLYWDFYQKVRLNLLLTDTPLQTHKYILPGQKGEDRGVEITKPWTLSYQDRKNQSYAPYGLGEFHDITSLWYMAGSLIELGAKINNKQIVNEFISSRQTPCGAFANVYGQNAPALDTDAHVVVTYQAIMTLEALGLTVPKADVCAAWIQSCQTDSGGFRFSAHDKSPSNKPDVWYTWAALRALDALGYKPSNVKTCLGWLNSLQNSDGGFGDRPEWQSRLYSTYYAVHALKILAGDAKKGISKKQLTKKTAMHIAEGKFSIFQAQLKTPPIEEGEDKTVAMVEAVRKLGFDFVGVKTTDVSAARTYVQAKGYPLEIVACPENYGHELYRRGGHPANHVCNWIIPPVMSTDQATTLNAADEAGAKKLPWPVFDSQVVSSVRQLGSLVYPEMDHSMINAYEVYDDDFDGRGGYNAVIGALGWPPWDWIRHFPYRERWVSRLPVISDSDSHGSITTWRLRLEKQRTLYIAESHLLGGFLDACRNHRTVCVIRDESVSTGFVYYGAPAAVAYVQKHRDQWKW